MLRIRTDKFSQIQIKRHIVKITNSVTICHERKLGTKEKNYGYVAKELWLLVPNTFQSLSIKLTSM